MKACLLAWFLIGFYASLARADDPGGLVGGFGDPNHLVFQGDSPFTSAQMIKAVQGDFGLRVASAPSAPLNDYLTLLTRRLYEGFARSGFYRPSVTVHADPATGNVLVNLDVGRRWKCGQVVVQGAKAVPMDAIVRCLTKPGRASLFQSTVSEYEISVSCKMADSPAKGDPDWVPGDPAPFDFYSSDRFTKTVRVQLAAMGYLHPFLKTSVEPGGADATLVVNLIDEGPKALLKNVEFDFLERNSPEAMEQFLKIKPNEPVDFDRICDMQRQLWESGRFLNHSISVERIPGDDVHVDLRVDIKEAPKLPLIDQSLPEVDQALLRFRKWLLTAGDDGEDLVVTATDPSHPDLSAKWIWGGCRGTAGRITLPENYVGIPYSLLGDDRDFRYAITGKSAVVDFPLAGLKMEGHLGPPFVTALLSFTTNKDPATTKPWDVRFGASATWDVADPGAGALRPQRWIDPVAVLDSGASADRPFKIEGPNLMFKQEGADVRIDAATGRLLSASFKFADRGIAEFQVRRGALEEMAKSLHESPDENIASADHPVGAAAELCWQMLCHSKLMAPTSTVQQRQRIGSVAVRLLDATTRGHLENLLHGVFSMDVGPEDFFLPMDLSEAHPEGIYAALAGWGLMANDRMFERGSWPWTLGNCVWMLLVNQSVGVSPELQRVVDSGDAGPLGCLAGEELLRGINVEASRTFAKKGLADLSAQAFTKDVETLFKGNADMKAIELQVAENLRLLGNDDVDAIAAQLAVDAGSAFRAAVEQLHKATGPMSSTQIDAALSGAWNSGGRAILEKELNRLAAP